MKFMLTAILYFAIVIEGLSPANPYRDIAMNEFWADQVAERLRVERIEKLLATIRKVESDGRYHIRGGSGEYGAYQFQRATWRFYCYLYEGKVLDIRIPENQDKIARMKVSDMVQNGYTDMQVAATWNSGISEGWEGRVGVNRWGVKFDTPGYVRKFMRAYNNGV